MELCYSPKIIKGEKFDHSTTLGIIISLLIYTTRAVFVYFHKESSRAKLTRDKSVFWRSTGIESQVLNSYF